MRSSTIAHFVPARSASLGTLAVLCGAAGASVEALTAKGAANAATNMLVIPKDFIDFQHNPYMAQPLRLDNGSDGRLVMLTPIHPIGMTAQTMSVTVSVYRAVFR